MRAPALVVLPAILLLAGAFYFFAKAKDTGAASPGASRYDQPSTQPAADLLADQTDRELIRQLLQAGDLTDDQANTLLRAAGRHYLRSKLALAASQQAVTAGTAPAASLEPLRHEMELARKVCDVAESLGRRRQELAAAAQADWELERRLAYIPSAMAGYIERFDGAAAFTEADLAQMEVAFQEHFNKPLPVSARGDSAVHRSMGFDHSGRFDVAVSPAQPEGVWARRYLTEKHVTFLAFRSAIPGKATGAHIHIGPPSIHRAPGT